MRPFIHDFLKHRFANGALSFLREDEALPGSARSVNGHHNGEPTGSEPEDQIVGSCSKLIEFFFDADLAIANAIASGQSVRQAAQQWVFHTERWLQMKVEGPVDRLVLDAALLMDEAELVEQEIGRFGGIDLLGAPAASRDPSGSDPFIRIIARSIVEKIDIIKATQLKLDHHKSRLSVKSRPLMKLEEKLASEEAVLDRTVLGAAKSPIIITARSSAAVSGRSDEHDVARLKSEVAGLERTIAEMRETEALREANHRAELDVLIAQRHEADAFARQFSDAADAARAEAERLRRDAEDAAKLRREIEGLKASRDALQKDRAALHQQVTLLKAALEENETALDELYFSYVQNPAAASPAVAAAVDPLLQMRAERHRREIVVLKELTLVSRRRWSWLLARPVRAVEVGLERLFKWDMRKHRTLIARSGYFDADWYLKAFPDVAAAGFEPFEHFLKYGLAEKRDPGPHFSNSRYLQENPDVAQSAMQPFVHYLTCGVIEGRVAHNSTIKIHG